MTLVGSLILVGISWVGALATFGAKLSVPFLKASYLKKTRRRETLEQIYRSFVESAPVILFSVAVVSGMSLLEFSYHMKLVLKQDSLVPAFSTLLLVRELAPVVTALLLASRIGAGAAAELGMMKTSEQIDQLKLLGVSPMEFLVVPRVIAGILASLFLSLLALGTALAASAVFASVWLHQSIPEFFQSCFLFTHPGDLFGMLLKAVAFGKILSVVSCYQGLNCQPGSRGVGAAATNAVVQSSLLIIISNFFLTLLNTYLFS